MWTKGKSMGHNAQEACIRLVIPEIPHLANKQLINCVNIRSTLPTA